jgi:hypothetical protein
VFAKGAKKAAYDAKMEVRRANAVEVLGRIGDTATLLQGCLENNQPNELLVRARDLISEVSRFKLRYERFLEGDSKARLDEAREQVSVISRSVSVRGLPTSTAERSRMLRIVHNNIVAILNEESAKIRAGIEKEQE